MVRIEEIRFEKTFDNTAAAYDKVRPAYPPAIFDDIFHYKPLEKESRVLEIGMGTGIASKPFLDTGCRFVGLEPGRNLAELAKRKFRNYDNVSVLTKRAGLYLSG